MANYIHRAEQAGLGWPLPPDIDERILGRMLFPSSSAQGHQSLTDLDYVSTHQALKSPGVTKFLLWQEYRKRHPDDGYSYAQFCHRYKSTPKGLTDHPDKDAGHKSPKMREVYDREHRREKPTR